MAYTLKPSNPIVRFAYLFQGRTPPRFDDVRWNAKKQDYERIGGYKATSLCPLFWRCVLNLVACLGAVGATGAAVYFLGKYLLKLTLHQWLVALYVAGGPVAVAGFVYGALYTLSREGLNYGHKIIDVLDKAGNKTARGIYRITDAMCIPLLWDMIKAVKSKMCPIVEFKE